MPRTTNAKTITLSHPEWCAQRHSDRCGPNAMFPTEQFHESLRKTFSAHGHPTEGGERFTVVSERYLMDGKTYDDDPEFDGGLQVTFNDPGTDDGPAAISIGSRDLRALAKFLEAEADAYDAWRQSQNARAHAEALREAAENQTEPKEGESATSTPERLEEGQARPGRRKKYTPATAAEEWHPSFCQHLNTCDTTSRSSVRHLSRHFRFDRPSSNTQGEPGGAGQELLVAVMAQLHHDLDASDPSEYTHDARVVLKNLDDGLSVGFTADSTRLRELGYWLSACAGAVDDEHEVARTEIAARHRPQKAA